MSKENVSEIQMKEQVFLFEKEPLAIVKIPDDENKTNEAQKIGTKDDSISKDNTDLRTENSNLQNIEITIWGNRRICIKKRLIPLRAAQLFWFASGNVCSPFFSLMLSKRGLKISEYSSVFSITILFQLLVAYICGIITDKIGNAKPVLLCLFLAVTVVVIGLILSPNVRDKLCLESDVNSTCLNAFNFTSDLENCRNVCPTNNTNYFIFKDENNTNIGSWTSSKIPNVLSNKSKLDDALYSNDTVVLCNEICLCMDEYTKNCSSTTKVEFKILYSALIVTFFSFWSTSFRFIDFAALTAAKKHDSYFANERIYGLYGALLATVLCNFVLNMDKSGTREFYDNVFWFSVALFVMGIISAFNIKGIISAPGLNFTKKTLQIFTDIEIVSVVLVVFVAGTNFTFHHFYQMWYLDSLKASKTTIGIQIITYSIYGIPMYKTSKWWQRKLGTRKIVVMSLLCHTINNIWYSFLYYPWVSILIEITKAFSFHLFWITTVPHCGKIAPKGFAATVNAVVGTVHFGVGRCFSVAVGGYLISTYGIRTTYRILAGFTLVAAILYSAFVYTRYFFSTKKKENTRTDIEEMKGMKDNEA